MIMDLTVSEHVIQIVKVELKERIDAFSAPRLREQMDALLAGGATQFVLDLSEVPFLDSAGMAVLVNLLKRAREAGGDVRLVWPQEEAARRVLHLTKFDRVFDIFESPEAALESFGG